MGEPGTDENVVSFAEWKAQQMAKRLRKVWVHYPIRDPNEPSGCRWELVEAIPLDPMA